MTEQAKEARRAYKKAWNAANKDKVKAANQRYWERKTVEAQQQTTDEQTADKGARAS